MKVNLKLDSINTQNDKVISFMDQKCIRGGNAAGSKHVVDRYGSNWTDLAKKATEHRRTHECNLCEQHSLCDKLREISKNTETVDFAISSFVQRTIPSRASMNNWCPLRRSLTYRFLGWRHGCGLN
jgi:hypothetical protein